MTDQEMLKLCLKAFTAITLTDAKKKFVRSDDILYASAYGGVASIKVAEDMRRKLRDHLKIEDEV